MRSMLPGASILSICCKNIQDNDEHLFLSETHKGTVFRSAVPLNNATCGTGLVRVLNTSACAKSITNPVSAHTDSVSLKEKQNVNIQSRKGDFGTSDLQVLVQTGKRNGTKHLLKHFLH